MKWQMGTGTELGLGAHICTGYISMWFWSVCARACTGVRENLIVSCTCYKSRKIECVFASLHAFFFWLKRQVKLVLLQVKEVENGKELFFGVDAQNLLVVNSGNDLPVVLLADCGVLMTQSFS